VSLNRREEEKRPWALYDSLILATFRSCDLRLVLGSLRQIRPSPSCWKLSSGSVMLPECLNLSNHMTWSHELARGAEVVHHPVLPGIYPSRHWLYPESSTRPISPSHSFPPSINRIRINFDFSENASADTFRGRNCDWIRDWSGILPVVLPVPHASLGNTIGLEAF